jgi:Protein of unknown function (DUF2924)
MTKSITQEIEELRALDVAALVERYTELHGRPPRSKHREWLWRRCAWKLQEQRLGGLSDVARRRIDELVAELDLPLGDGRTVRDSIPRATKPGTPPIGSALTRTWRGKQMVVAVVEGGYVHEGVQYRSLSAVANAITGSHVSGRAWFGLVARKESR